MVKKILTALLFFILGVNLFQLEAEKLKLEVADFDTGEVNDLGGKFSINVKEPSTLKYTFDKVQPLGNTGRSLKLIYNKQGDERHWIAWWTYLERDIRAYDSFSFWVKGESGKENFSVTLSESEEKTASLYLEDFLPGGVPAQWQKVTIPLKSFLENFAVPPEKIETIVLGFPEFGEGTLYIDSIAFEKEPQGEKREVRVNGFDDENPNLIYYTKVSGECEVRLDSAKQAKAGQNSLKLMYKLESFYSYQAKAGFIYKPDRLLSLTGAERVHIWVRGDGSGNRFYMNITDMNGELFSYQDNNVLYHDEWRKVSVPISDFRNEGVSKKSLNTSGISSIEIGVAGVKRGTHDSYILVDELTVSGKGLKIPLKKDKIPEMERRYLKWHSLKFLKEVRSETEFWNTEAGGLRMFQNFILRTDFTYKNFNFQGDVIIYGRLRPFHESGYLDPDDNEKELRSKDYDIVGRNLKLNILDPADGVERITFGNIYIDYDKYTV
ncbi:MAG: CIA30 family protein, partial [Spirochaetes bacterium]|nr:CIA30 family protein [Spirochaetota bacterium]